MRGCYLNRCELFLSGFYALIKEGRAEDRARDRVRLFYFIVLQPCISDLGLLLTLTCFARLGLPPLVSFVYLCPLYTPVACTLCLDSVLDYNIFSKSVWHFLDVLGI